MVHGCATTAEYRIACCKQRGDIFAPAALVRTLTWGPRLENGLASTLLEVFFHIEGLCFSPSERG